MNISGAADFTDATVVVSLADGFGPTNGDQYEIISFASQTALTTFEGLDPFFAASLSETDVTLNVQSSAVNLVADAQSISVPSSAGPGDLTTIGYSVTNASSSRVEGDWDDSIYLSADTQFDESDVLIGRVTHTGGVDGFATYSETLTARMPGVIDGDYHVIVIADSKRKIAETNREDNTVVSLATIAATIPGITLGSSTTQTVVDGQNLYLKLDVPVGRGDVVIDAALQQLIQADVFVRFNELPTRTEFDFLSNQAATTSRSITIPSTRAGSWYILIAGREGAATPTDLLLSTQRIEFAVASVSPLQGSNSGQTTVSIDGSGFTDATVVELVDATGTVIAQATTNSPNPNRVFATFDLDGADIGSYSLRVSESAFEATADTTFEVITGNPGELLIDVILPGATRAGREYNGTIEYRNVGNTDIVAPLVRLKTSTTTFKIGTADAFTQDLRFVAVSENGAPGILAPGEVIRIPMRVFGGDHSIEGSVWEADATQDMDWTVLRDAIAPVDPAQEWFTAFDQMIASAGTEIGNYVQLLADAATSYAERYGEVTGDEYELLRFLIHEGIVQQQLSFVANLSLDEAGLAASDVLVVATNTETDESYSAVSTHDGLLRFVDLTPGTYSLEFDGVLPPTGIESLEVPEGGITSAFEWVVGTGAAILGRAGLEDRVAHRDDDESIIPSVTATSSVGDVFTTDVDEFGNYEFRGLPDGIYQLQFETLATVPTVVTGVSATAFTSTNAPDLVSDYGGIVSGRVIDSSTSEPIEGAVVLVHNQSGFSRSAATDADGRYEVQGIPEGVARVTVSTDESGDFVADSIVIQKRETTGGIDFSIINSNVGVAQGAVTLGGNAAGNAGVDLVQGNTTVAGTMTEVDGSYEIVGVAPGVYELEVNFDGAIVDRTSVTIVGGQAVTQDVDLVAATTLRGTASYSLATGNAPFPNQSLNLITPSGEGILLLTDESGAFGADQLAPGSYLLMLPDGSHRTEFSVAAGATTIAIDFGISVGSIVGEVRDHSQAFTISDLTVDLLSNGNLVDSTTTNFRGVYAFPLVSPGTYSIRVSGESYFAEEVQGVVLTAGGYVEVESTVGAQSLSVSFVDAASQPVTDDVVFAIQPLDAEDRNVRVFATEAGTGIVENMIPGQHRIVADLGDTRYQAIVTIDASTTELQIELGPSAVVSGVVTDSQNQVLDGAAVAIIDRSQPELVWVAVTDSDGAWQLDLPLGDYRVTVAELDTEDPFSIDSPIEFMLDQNLTVNLSLADGTETITGALNVSNTQQASVPTAATISLLNEDGIAIRTTTADADGNFQIDGVVAGVYTVSAEANGYSFGDVGVSIGGTGVVSVDLTGAWHVPSDGPGYETPAQDDGAAFAPIPSASTVASWVKQGVQGLRETLEEALQKPTAEPRLIRVPRAPQHKCITDVSAAVNAASRKALEMQRAADGFFDAWVQRWGAAQEILWADVGLFGVNLGVFASDLLLSGKVVAEVANAPALQDLLGRLKQGKSEAAFNYLLNGGKDPSLQRILTGIGEEIDAVQATFDLVANREAILGSVKAVSGSLGSIVTEGVSGATAGLGDILSGIQNFASNPSLGSASAVASSVTAFGGRLGTHASTLLTLFPSLEAQANKIPALRPIVKILGPLTNALNTISASAQTLSDGLGEIEALDELEANYRNALARRDRALAAAYRALAGARRIDDCEDEDEDPPQPPFPPTPAPPLPNSPWVIAGVRSFDPNDITGPAGFGEEHHVRPELTFPYQIRFENVSDATAPAQEVFITQQLSNDLDWSTFEVGDFGWGDRIVDVPEGLNFYETRIDATATLGFFVDFRAEVNLTTGLASWTFTSTDPATGDLIADALAGFLPPNATAPEGEGFVEYSIRPKATVVDGTRIDAEAEIIFDLNEPIDTPVYSNVIDDAAPSSNVIALPASSPRNVTVSWAGEDGPGSGVVSYDVYVSEDDGPYELWLTTDEASAVFEGTVGSTYAFYSRATDGVNLREQEAPHIDAFTTIVDSSRAILDIDGDGLSQPLTDGILALRHMANFTGLALVDGAAASNVDPQVVEDYLSSINASMDIDGNGSVQPLTDGLLIVRYLAGFRNNALIRDVVDQNGTRTTAPQIQQYLASLTEVNDGAAAAQVVTASPGAQSALGGSTVSVEFGYSVTNTEDRDATGLNLRMHYDAGQLSLNSISPRLQHGFVSQQTFADVDDLDEDPSTTHYLAMLWVDTAGSWPDPVDASLFTATFATVASFESATINLTGDAAEGYRFVSHSATIDAIQLVLNESNGSTLVSEIGNGDTVDVRLNAQPVSNVVVSVTNGGSDEYTTDTTQLVFTPDNWNVRQRVFVRGVDDAVLDGTTLSKLNFQIAGSTAVRSIDVLNLDYEDNVTVTGTSQDDTFSLAISTPNVLRLNGVEYAFRSDNPVVRFDGSDGLDSVSLWGSSANDTGEITADSASLQSDAYDLVTVNTEINRLYNEGGEGRLLLHDTDLDETVVLRPTGAYISGTGRYAFGAGFNHVRAVAAGGEDIVHLYDGPGDDQLIHGNEASSLVGEGYSLRVEGFTSVEAFASGGTDTALIYDTPGDDAYIADPKYASLTSDSVFRSAARFETTTAYSNAGGFDTAEIRDSEGDDVLISRYDHTYLISGSVQNHVRNFELVQAFATRGGNDEAQFYDSSGSDKLVVRPTYTYLYKREDSFNFLNYQRGFDKVRAFSTKGGTDLFQQSSGLDYFFSRSEQWQLGEF